MTETPSLQHHAPLTSVDEHFFVLSLWTFSYDLGADRFGRILEISGTPANLAVAAHVHDRRALALLDCPQNLRKI